MTISIRTILAAMLATAVLGAPCAASADAFRDGFVDPPNAARPRVWWHWMNGNVTKDGIAKDLAWMQSVGIGGLQNFDANLATPQVVDKRLVYMTPEWKDAFRFATGLAEEKGLELAIAASPGWSETGGPWVKPEDGIKKLVWSETLVAGGKKFNGTLAAPPSTTGPFQDAPLFDALAGFEGGPHREPPKHYADVAVLAIPAGAGALPLPIVTSAGRSLDARALMDGFESTTLNLERGTPKKPTEVHIAYAIPQTVRSATISLEGEVSPFTGASFLPVLEANVDGTWRRLASLPLTAAPTTASFAPVTAREFRVVFGPDDAPARIGLGDGAPGAINLMPFGPKPADAPVKVATLALSGDARVDRFEAKAGFSIERDYYALGTVNDDAAGVAPSQVLDLTSRLKADGTLDWTPPKGAWRVLRLGWSLTGKTNHPAPPEATGLEVDKFDGAAVRRYLETYLGMYRDAAGADLIGETGVRALLTDSIEVGASNWTPALIEKFTQLRGYDPRPWLPALTGTIVGTRAQSDAFLYDFRRTLADLVATEHYGTVAKVAHEHRLKVYGEALEDVRPSLGDDLAMRKYADVPMAALWTWSRDGIPRPTLIGDMKGAASVAHLYGQNVVAAESMTAAMAPWAFAPADLRRIVDLEFASGVNRPVVHTSVHQPVDDKVPGLSLAIFGQYFNRHESWAPMARAWVDYIARNSYLLQSGRNYADVAYFYGEEQPLTALYAQSTLPDTPKRYAFDFVNADVLANVLSVEGGDLVAKSGARYRVLYLGGTSERMTLPTLKRIAALVEAGATVVGDAPKGSPAFADDPAEYGALVRRLWSGAAVTYVGKGRVVAGRDVEAALASIGVGPDFAYSAKTNDAELMFVHRGLVDGDAYFVNNRKNRAASVEARFRVAGKRPELWHADTGRSEPVSYRIANGETIVPLDFGPEDSYFVVFRDAATESQATVARPVDVALGEIGGPWNVAFQANRGAPASATLAKLQALETHEDPGIRYFSGIATYSARFTLPKLTYGQSLWIDLGRVGDVAEVRVNGRELGTVWKAPYRVEVGAAAKRGANQLEVRVATTWVNRLIGDAQPGAKKITFTTLPTYRPDAPLRASGLIGPVRLMAVQGPR